MTQGFALLVVAALAQIWMELQIDTRWLRLVFIALTTVVLGAGAATVSYDCGLVSHRTAFWRAMMFLIAMNPVRIALYHYLGETP